MIVAADGTEKSYSPADLEKFQTYSLTTTTPWRDDPADFQGVLLNDVLAANGLTRPTPSSSRRKTTTAPKLPAP